MMRHSKLVCVFMVLTIIMVIGLVGPVDAAIFYAEPGGTGDGTAWNKTAELRVILTSGLLKTGDQVWVKAGIYYPTDDSDPTKNFKLINGVEIYGGFSEFSASIVLADRNPENHVTTLSGDIGTAIDRDNSFHVVTSDSSITASTVLDGFTITGGCSFAGYDMNDDPAPGKGGGMFNNGGSPTLRNCKFVRNTVISEGGESNGGGMFNEGGSPTLTNCTFSYNFAENGGGIVTNDRASLTNCTFSNNTADEYGGGMYKMYGGYGDYEDSPGAMVMLNCTFTDNTAFEGGGIFQDNYYPALVLKNTIIAGNTGGDYPDIQGSITSGGHNLIGSVGNYIFDTNTTGDQYGDPNNTTTPNTGAEESATAIDPRLEALADNGGTTRTHALLPDSPAINAGDNTGPETDQRGGFPDSR